MNCKPAKVVQSDSEDWEEELDISDYADIGEEEEDSEQETENWKNGYES